MNLLELINSCLFATSEFKIKVCSKFQKGRNYDSRHIGDRARSSGRIIKKNIQGGQQVN